MTSPRILVVDDEPGIRDMLRLTLEYEGYLVVDAADGPSALATAASAAPDAVLLDVKMQGMDGMEVLDALHAGHPDLPIIMLTGHGTIETAVEAVRRGAFDFLSKPPDRDKILITLRNALTQRALLRENESMRSELGEGGVMIGSTPAMLALRESIARVGPTEAYVLITGENGTGKELVARALHAASLRSARPMVEVNCAAIPNELIESELFGHEKGAFTGAAAQRIGRFEQADGGTLLLDEIGDMSIHAQAKVLRVLEEGTFERVGGTRQLRVDVRVIAATNKNLPKEIREQRFREDLFHRLNVIPLHVPPLRERRDDIPLLVAHFLDEVCRRNKLGVRRFDEGAMRRLAEMNWPGNVRELRNAIERLAILVSATISAADVARFVQSAGDAMTGLLDADLDFQEFKDRSEALYIRRQLERFDWNVSRTAEEIGLQRSHLYTKLKRYGLARDEAGDQE
jgi:two-component system, NtrC family, nitrogen regulation response regulator NtrX